MKIVRLHLPFARCIQDMLRSKDAALDTTFSRSRSRSHKVGYWFRSHTFWSLENSLVSNQTCVPQV